MRAPQAPHAETADPAPDDEKAVCAEGRPAASTIKPPQLRRNTDRFVVHRLAQIALAVALILTVKLIKWADRWNRAP